MATTILPFRKSPQAVSAGAMTLPQDYFVSDQIFATEREKIFGKTWFLIGRDEQIAKPGDYFLAEVADETIIATRDKSGTMRGFYNVCRHRGARMCEEPSGRLSAIQCPYHAWTYSLDGKLAGAPDMPADFDKNAYSLVPIRVQTWDGFLFANLDGESGSTTEWFAPLTEKFADWKMSSLRVARGKDYDVQANWKLIFQNYSECYHCSGVHPELTKLSPDDSAENDLVEGPFLGGFMRIQEGKSLSQSGRHCAVPINSRDARLVYYYSIFPNMLLSLHPDYVMVHTLRPKSPGETHVHCEWLFAADAPDRDGFNPEDAVEFWDMVNQQDWHVCELSQQGISSRAYRSGPYSPRETIPAAWDREYLRRMA